MVRQGAKIRLEQIGKSFRRPDGTIVDNPGTVEGIAPPQKDDEEEPVLKGIHEKVDSLNHGILPNSVNVVRLLDRSDLVKLRVTTVKHNLSDEMIILFLLLGKVRGAIAVSRTILLGPATAVCDCDRRRFDRQSFDKYLPDVGTLRLGCARRRFVVRPGERA
jgi:Cu/Ag efflux pump CusA